MRVTPEMLLEILILLGVDRGRLTLLLISCCVYLCGSATWWTGVQILKYTLNLHIIIIIVGFQAHSQVSCTLCESSLNTGCNSPILTNYSLPSCVEINTIMVSMLVMAQQTQSKNSTGQSNKIPQTTTHTYIHHCMLEIIKPQNKTPPLKKRTK